MIEQLKELLKQKKSNDYYANKLGVSVEEVKRLKRIIKSGNTPLKAEIPESDYSYAGDGVWKWSINKDKGTLDSTIELDYDPKDDLELAKEHKVDLTKYVIASYYSKKLPSGKFTSTLLCRLKKPTDYTAEDFAKFLEKYKPSIPSYKWGFTPENTKTTVDVELSVADVHLAKKTLDNETLEDKINQYNFIVYDLCKKVSDVYNINTLVFPISNDFFHTDNYQNQTTNGTPQDVLVGYDHEYEAGFDLLVKNILYLQTVCQNVKIILVQGNHDRTKSFYLAHALEVFFKGNKKISFQREHSVTKSIVLGNTFIGYHHGNCKIEDLPLLFATGKDSAAFGNALYREVHTGDKHHYMAKEVKGVRIQQMPSLSGTDRWHLDNNFVHSIKAGIATCYDHSTGRIAEFESRIQCKP